MHRHLLMVKLFLLIFAALPSPASAQSVFKCESDGQVTYRDNACTDGKPLNLPDSRGFGNTARDQTGTNKSVLQRLPKNVGEEQRSARLNERRDKADEQRRQTAEKQKMKCAQLEQRKKWAEEDQQAATLKSLEKARRRTQRATELYLARCRT